MRVKNILYSLLACVGIVSLAGISVVASGVMDMIDSEPGVLCTLGIVFGVGYAAWGRAAGSLPSRDALRRISGLKLMAAQSGDPVWRLSWLGKLVIPTFAFAVCALSPLWDGAPRWLGIVEAISRIAFIISFAYLVCYATLYGAGKIVRSGLPDDTAYRTDGREAVINWGIVILAVSVLAYFPGTRDVACVIAPMALLAAWIREIDILRDGLPLAALRLMSAGVATSLMSSDQDTTGEDPRWLDDSPSGVEVMCDPSSVIMHPNSVFVWIGRDDDDD